MLANDNKDCLNVWFFNIIFKSETELIVAWLRWSFHPLLAYMVYRPRDLYESDSSPCVYFYILFNSNKKNFTRHSSTNKIDCHDITELLLKVAVKHHNPKPPPLLKRSSEEYTRDMKCIYYTNCTYLFGCILVSGSLLFLSSAHVMKQEISKGRNYFCFKYDKTDNSYQP